MKRTTSCWALEVKEKFERREGPGGKDVLVMRGSSHSLRLARPFISMTGKKHNWQCPISYIPPWMCPAGWDSSESYKHATVVDFTSKLLECLWRTPIHSREQRCHAGQLVSGLFFDALKENNTALNVDRNRWAPEGGQLLNQVETVGKGRDIFWMRVLINKRWQVIWMSGYSVGPSDWMLTFSTGDHLTSVWQTLEGIFSPFLSFFFLLSFLSFLSSFFLFFLLSFFFLSFFLLYWVWANDPTLIRWNPGGSIFNPGGPQISSSNDQLTFVLQVSQAKNRKTGEDRL